ncbi:MAG: ferritin-like domain-containing protein [Armatimonadota bacterium]|nr:ferritin-like domain-containing protein [Armatimonadota bacterium]
MEMESLKDLFVEELKDIYSAETQITKALPKMAKAATTPELKAAFETHLEETKGQIARIEQIFEKLGGSPKGKTCKAMQGLVEEGSELLEEKPDKAVLDAGLIAAAQRVEHYEIAAYGTARTYALELGHKDVAKLLQETLDEEGKTDKLLTKLAESVVNLKAVEGAHAKK